MNSRTASLVSAATRQTAVAGLTLRMFVHVIMH